MNCPDACVRTVGFLSPALIEVLAREMVRKMFLPGVRQWNGPLGIVSR